MPSITGLAASGPMSPRPSTAVPLVITATRLPRAVTVETSLGSATIASQAAATPGEYASERSFWVTIALVGATLIFPGRVLAVVFEGLLAQVVSGGHGIPSRRGVAPRGAWKCLIKQDTTAFCMASALPDTVLAHAATRGAASGRNATSGSTQLHDCRSVAGRG